MEEGTFMKNIVFGFFVAIFCNACFAKQITLLCNGWNRLYQTIDGSPTNPKSDHETLIIELDMDKRVAKYQTQLGDVRTKFDEKNYYYTGKTAIASTALGGRVSLVNLSIRRLDGETVISFHSASVSKPAFSGKCLPAKPLF
ncbi:hypothetical protein [Massilia sp. KIM]|uniref:hypothetical protein n=1 Tax=Massilia sp. KIM TaxID=1955422 RepID=UPI00117FFAB1|nr:hypothetical protein [Massilia sp. KIM]